MTKAKFCGFKELKTLEVAIESGADFIGFNFYSPSPRAVSIEQAASLSKSARNKVTRVGLFVDPDDALLKNAIESVGLDMIQLHGDEPVDRVKMILMTYNVPVMKALRIATKEDLESVSAYEEVADWILFDAKIDGTHGGTGKAFDWTLLKDYPHHKPWMLAGGLKAENIGEALSVLKPDAVDVSSGLETTRGQKDPDKIRAFMDRIKQIESEG